MFRPKLLYISLAPARNATSGALLMHRHFSLLGDQFELHCAHEAAPEPGERNYTQLPPRSLYQRFLRTRFTNLVRGLDYSRGLFHSRSTLRAIVRRVRPAAIVTVTESSLYIPVTRAAAAERIPLVLIYHDWSPGWPFSARHWLHLVRHTPRRFRRDRPDWVLIPRSCGDYLHMVLVAWWTGAPHICAHESLCCTMWGSDRRPLVNPSPAVAHEVSEHARMLAHLGLGSPDLAPLLTIPTDATAFADRQFARTTLPPRLIALGIGAGSPDRQWPVDHFQELVQRLVTSHPDLGFVIIGGPSERVPGELICATAPVRSVNFAGQLTLLQSLALLRRCYLYIGNDSGPMHLAAAAGCANVEISKHPLGADDESPNSPRHFGPVTLSARILRPQPLAPECRRGCEHTQAHCITAVSVSSVVTATRELLATTSVR